MPTIVFLTIAYQIQNLKWRYLFFALSAISFIYNLYYKLWTQEIYSVTTAMVLFMLTPHFSQWWQKRNERGNPSSLWDFAREAWLLTKYNKYKLFFWISFLIVSITGICFYTGFTNQALLGSLLAGFCIVYGLKNIFCLILPPEWFLHDVSTEYIFLSVFIAYLLSDYISQKLSVHFTLPMIIVALTCLVGFILVKKTNRYLIPGCALIFADIVWQLIRLMQENNIYSSSFITTVCILVVTMLIGLIWLIKKPGVMPILYLVLFQLFRFSTFSYEAIERANSNDLSVPEASDYMLYLVCWMYIVPLLFWIIGLRQVGNIVENRPVRVNKRFEDLKKRAANS